MDGDGGVCQIFSSGSNQPRQTDGLGGLARGKPETAPAQMRLPRLST